MHLFKFSDDYNVTRNDNIFNVCGRSTFVQVVVPLTKLSKIIAETVST